MNIIDIAKQIAANPLVRHGEGGPWMCSYDPDAVTVARELLRLTDPMPATRHWLESVGVSVNDDGYLLGIYRFRFSTTDPTRGEVRLQAMRCRQKLKESE